MSSRITLRAAFVCFLTACSSTPDSQNGIFAMAGAAPTVSMGGASGTAGTPPSSAAVSGQGGTSSIVAGAAGSAGSDAGERVISRATYAEKLEGFWLGQSIANWTGLVTELDKDGVIKKDFYTDASWGGPDAPTIYGAKSEHETIDFVLVAPGSAWRSDDDTDIEYIYWDAMERAGTALLSGAQIREAWLAHVYKETEVTPWGVADRYSLPPPQQNDGKTYYENKLWVSNETAFHLMQGISETGQAIAPLEPPATGDPSNNSNWSMIDAQLTTESFGLLSPGRPDTALELARLPIQTTARGEAQAAAEFYVVMYALAFGIDPQGDLKQQLFGAADQARSRLADGSYPALMYDAVKSLYLAHPVSDDWEAVRDAVYTRFQLGGEGGYGYQKPFDSGINFASGLISLFFGEGDLKRTIQIGTLCGWDSDNPTATWGGLLGFILGKSRVEAAFGQALSGTYDIHATRKGFPNDGSDTFAAMAERGVGIVDHVVVERWGGRIDAQRDAWVVPASP